MNETYEKFLSDFLKIKSEQSQMIHVMETLQDMGNEKKFKEFQEILDNAEPEKFGDSSVTIALVAWWYGENLNRKEYCLKGIEHYDKLKGDGYGIKLFGKFMEGSWKPMFGFERGLFNVKE